MRYLLIALIAALSLPAASAAHAQSTADAEGWADKFACATQRIAECDVSGECVQVSHQEVNAPAFIRVDLEQMIIYGRQRNGVVRTSRIAQQTLLGGHLVLQGVDLGAENDLAAAGWTLTVEPEGGAMTMAVAAEGVSLSAFGVCEAP